MILTSAGLFFSTVAGFGQLPQPKPCPWDMKQCDDGSYVSRNGYDDCNWEPCPEDGYGYGQAAPFGGLEGESLIIWDRGLEGESHMGPGPWADFEDFDLTGQEALLPPEPAQDEAAGESFSEDDVFENLDGHHQEIGWHWATCDVSKIVNSYGHAPFRGPVSQGWQGWFTDNTGRTTCKCNSNGKATCTKDGQPHVPVAKKRCDVSLVKNQFDQQPFGTGTWPHGKKGWYRTTLNGYTENVSCECDDGYLQCKFA